MTCPCGDPDCPGPPPPEVVAALKKAKMEMSWASPVVPGSGELTVLPSLQGVVIVFPRARVPRFNRALGEWPLELEAPRWKRRRGKVLFPRCSCGRKAVRHRLMGYVSCRVHGALPKGSVRWKWRKGS